MRNILLATSNRGKLEELISALDRENEALAPHEKMVYWSAADVGLSHIDPPEVHVHGRGNAAQKAEDVREACLTLAASWEAFRESYGSHSKVDEATMRHSYERLKEFLASERPEVLAEDTVFVVEALKDPGVKAKRYAENSPARAEKVLSELARRGQVSRDAWYGTYGCLVEVPTGAYREFSGIVRGTIAEVEPSVLKRPEYQDALKKADYGVVFVPEGKNTALAFLPAAERDEVSHRGRMIAEMGNYLRGKEVPEHELKNFIDEAQKYDERVKALDENESGRTPVDKMREEGVNLHRHFRRAA